MKKKKGTSRLAMPDWKTTLGVLTLIAIVILILSGRVTPSKVSIFGVDLVFNTPVTTPSQVTQETPIMPNDTTSPIPSDTLVVNATEASTPIATAEVSSTPTQLVVPKNCISDRVWMPYNGETRSKDEIGCWDLFDWGILAKDGGMQFSKTASNTTELSHGIYSPLPQNTRIEFTLRIDKIDSVSDLEPRLEFGILPLNPVESDKGIFIFIQRESYNDATLYIKLHNPLRNRDEYVPLRYIPRAEEKVLIIINGLQLDIFIGDEKIVDALPLAFPEKGFWLGYSLPGGTNLSAFISNIVIKDLQ